MGTPKTLELVIVDLRYYYERDVHTQLDIVLSDPDLHGILRWLGLTLRNLEKIVLKLHFDGRYVELDADFLNRTPRL